jgi:hypothetical protein
MAVIDNKKLCTPALRITRLPEKCFYCICHSSPDFNPIGKTWANMKKELRDAAPLHELIETAIYAYLT